MYRNKILAFDTITTESAYWVGFLMADGNIFGNSIQVELSEVDKEQLVKLKGFLGVENALTYVTRTNSKPSYKLSIGSKYAVEKLAKFGVTPRKSKTAKVSNDLALNRDFWRGIIDGGGTLGVYKKRGRKDQYFAQIALVGSEFIMEQFMSYVRTILPTCNRKILNCENGSYFKVGFTAKQARAIITAIYNGAPDNIRLCRKYEKAMEILDRYGLPKAA